MKKNRMENDIVDDVLKLDQALLAAVKKNLRVGRYLSEKGPESLPREPLLKWLSRHPFRPAEKALPQPEQVLTEEEKTIQKFSRYLKGIPESERMNLLEWVKSMHRRYQSAAPHGETQANTSGGNRRKQVPKGTTGTPEGPISGASGPSV